jgi:hypothetical protein
MERGHHEFASSGKTTNMIAPTMGTKSDYEKVFPLKFEFLTNAKARIDPLENIRLKIKK